MYSYATEIHPVRIRVPDGCHATYPVTSYKTELLFALLSSLVDY